MFESISTDQNFPAQIYTDLPIGEWDDAFKEKLRDMLQNHHVLVLRGLKMTPADQINFTNVFGEIAAPWDQTRVHPETSLVQVVSNAGRKSDYKSTTLFWHSDESFTICPNRHTILHAVIIPPIGGNTMFANLRAAYEDYPENEKNSLTELKAVHSFRLVMSPLVASRVSAEAAQMEEQRFPDVRHPLIRTIPGTEQKAFYLNQLCVSHLEPLTTIESEELLNSLYSHCLQEKYIYSHKWQSGDTVIWDNSCLLHRVENIPSYEPRVLHRTITQGQIPEGSKF